MASSNNGYLHTDSPPPSLLPSWLASSGVTSTVRPPSPSVTLSLTPSAVTPAPPIPWLQHDRLLDNQSSSSIGIPSLPVENRLVSELMECCRELDEGHHVWAAHKKEVAWRLRRVEMQLESEKANWRREKMMDTEAKVKALREEQKASLDRIETENKEQLAELRRESQVKEQKLADQWAAKHSRLTSFLKQMGQRSTGSKPSSR